MMRPVSLKVGMGDFAFAADHRDARWLGHRFQISLLPTPESIVAAAASLGPRTPADERLTLVNAPGANAYPLVNFE